MLSNPILVGGNSQVSSPEFDDLWLPVWSGEVLTAFDESFISQNFVRTKTIMTGVEQQFPRLGRAEAETHERGNKLLGLDIERGEVNIRLDERSRVHHFRIDDVDQIKPSPSAWRHAA